MQVFEVPNCIYTHTHNNITVSPSLRRKHFHRQKQRDMTNRAATVVTEIRMVRAVPTEREREREGLLLSDHSLLLLIIMFHCTATAVVFNRVHLYCIFSVQ